VKLHVFVVGCGGFLSWGVVVFFAGGWRWWLVVRQFGAVFGVIGMTFCLVRFVRFPLC
jgi:hypothetical protein